MSKPIIGRHRMWRIAGYWQKMMRTGIALVLIVCAQAALADYRVEFDGSYSETTGANPESENLNLAVEVFLQPVDDSKGPFAEAAFLSRASSLRYQFDRSEIKSPNLALLNVSEFDRPIKTHQLRARYVMPQSGWILSLLAARPESQLRAPSDDEGYRIGAGVGRYLNQATSLEFNLSYAERDTTTQFNQDCPFVFTLIEPDCDQFQVDFSNDSETLSADVRLRRVGKIGNQTFATTLLVGYANLETKPGISDQRLVDSNGNQIPFDGLLSTPQNGISIDSWNTLAAGTWFITRKLGIDASWAFTSTPGLDVHSVGGGFGWFVSPNVELRANYRESFEKQNSGSAGQWRATLRARF